MITAMDSPTKGRQATKLNVYRIRFEIPDMVNTSGVMFRDGRTPMAAVEKAISEIPSAVALVAGRVDWKLVAKRCTLEQYRAAHPEAKDER